MYSREDTNYRNEGQSNPGGQSSSYMSVAAKAGEMQIFSSDIHSQVNGIQRRLTQKTMVRHGAKYSSHTNDNRLNHIQEQINHVEETMLQIDAVGVKPTMSAQEHSQGQNMHSTLQNHSNERLQPLTTQSMNSNMQRDSLPGRPKLTSLQNHQRLHPTQTFGEYVATNASNNGKSRMKMNLPINSSSGNNPLLLLNQQQKQLNSTEAHTTNGAFSSNGQMSNSSQAIGIQPVSQYSGKGGEMTVQNSPQLDMHHKSQKGLQIEVQSSQTQKRPVLDPNVVVDSTFTPTMIRRSIGSRSAAKQQEAYSFLDKAAQQTNQIAAASFDVKNNSHHMPSMPATSTGTAKKLQAPKEVNANQLFQNRYTNGNEPHMLPRMAGNAIERRNANQSKQKNSSLPPTGSLSMVQQGHLRRRHGEGSFGGQEAGRPNFGIAGESLQIKLTGTSLMNRNQQARDSYSQQVQKEPDNTMVIPSMMQATRDSQPGIYHPKLRARMPELPPQFNSVSGIGVTQMQQPAVNFAQQMAEMQMNSPRNGNQIFQENPQQHSRVYSYHYIYDYLFVQVNEDQYEREYSRRIRTFQKTDSDLEQTPESHVSGPSDQPSIQIADPAGDNSPKRLRGPALNLNRNQVFFSPNAKENLTSVLDQKDAATSRFRQDTDGMNDQEFAEQNKYCSINPGSIDSSDYMANRKKVVKVHKKFNMRNTLENALQSTQFEGLKVLTRETILKANKHLEHSGRRAEENSQIVPSLKLNNVNNDPDQQAMQDDENVGKFMIELGTWLQDQNQRFKVTVKKKYINDILMQSKGAQNLAQNVVMVVTNNANLSMNSPIKKAKRQKRHMSVDASSEEDVEGEQAGMRVNGQATPQVTSSKAKIHQIGRRGYESENEARSLNSTTTSSTFPNLAKGGYATKQQNTPRQPRKMSTRSLSQIPNTVRVQRKATEDINGSGAAAGGVGGDDLMNQLNTKYAATKIKIVQDVNKYNDHMDHPINKMLSDYNEFTRLVFRTRLTEARAVQNIPYAIKLGKRLGMQLTKNQLMPATLKVRENSNAIKEKLIFHMCKVLKEENQFEPAKDQTCSLFNKQISDHTVKHMEQVHDALTAHEAVKQQAFHYRCYVGKGNNQMMVRALFKNRFWWLFHEKEEPEKVNFFWTQLRKLSIMNSLQCKFVNPKDKKQKQDVSSLSFASPSAGLGMAIANNAAIVTPNGSKFKKRKISSAHSKSPDQVISRKQSEVVQSEDVSRITAARRSETNVSAEERKADIAAVTCYAPPENTKLAQSPPPRVTKEDSKNQEKGRVERVKVFDTYPVKLANKIEDNYHLCNKKALLVNMKNYYEAIGEDPFAALPVTFHVKEGLQDAQFLAFKAYYEEHNDPNNIWITKPGECTNRGVGIQVAKEWNELVGIISESTRSSKKTCIVQKYIHNPLLIHRRKFDIRTFCMATSNNGNYKAYYYQEGYLRTSCREFSLNNLSNRMVHLTNDAVQKKSEDYGKFEPGNKLSYTEFQNYIDKYCGAQNVCFERDILPQIKKLTNDCFRATYGKMDPFKRYNTFECFGLDFMIDEAFKVYLIEVNTNPCLELSSPLLARLIPSMVENSLRLAVDPLFPPPEHFSQRKTVVNELCPENKFELIFDERIDGPELIEIFREKDNIIIEIDEEELSDADIEGNAAAEK